MQDYKIEKLADIFKCMSDPTRLKIIHVLASGKQSVNNISEAIGMGQSATSHQLRKLKDMKLVKSTKDGRMVLYSLDDDHVLKLFTQGLEHVEHLDV